MNNLVSIIVPAYNQAEYLPTALNSVLAQTHSNWECIIVNDGSPDNSEAIALDYCRKDSRFKYLKKENGGLSSARNAGLKKAKGDWVQFLDSDDYLAPEKLQLSVDLIIQNPDVQLVVSNFSMFTESPQNATPAFCHLNQQRLTFDSILFKWDAEFNIPIHCGLFKATVFADTQFIETLRISEDWVMWLDIFGSNIKALYLDAPLAYYRINPKSMTKDATYVRFNLLETYKYLLPRLQVDDAFKFTGIIFDRLHDTMLCYEKDLSKLRGKLYYKAEKGTKDILRKLIKGRKR